KVLYNFCSLTSCADGYNPYAGLVMDSSGHLYGTTEFGVPNACGNDNLESGTVFELASNNGNWSQSTLYSFCSQANDGFQPDAPVIVDGSGDLLGTTYYGGSNDDGGYGGGTVFQLTP